MGFAPERVDWALYATKNAGLQPALDHLEANQDGPIPADYKSAAAATGSSSAGAAHDVSMMGYAVADCYATAMYHERVETRR